VGEGRYRPSMGEGEPGGEALPERTTAAIGMRVMVNIAGYSAGGAQMGDGTFVDGTIIGVGLAGITVRLSTIIGGTDQVTVSPDRVKAIR